MSEYEGAILYGKVGPAVLADGTPNSVRLNRVGALVTAPVHGKYTETALRHRMFFSYCAARATSIPATAQIGNIIWNPPGSGVNLAMGPWTCQIQVTSATTLGITFGYSVQPIQPTTTTVADASGCTFLTGSMVGQARAFAIATIVTAPTPVMNLFHNTAAINTVGIDQVHGDFEGLFIIPPGYIGCLSAITAAVAAVGMTSTLTWEEVPI